jgi:hypothetical protein
MREENLDYLKPRHREWSLANTNTPPTVILVCGIDGCDEYVGEVKTDKADSEIAIALIYNRFGERTVPCTPLQTSDLTWAEEARDASGRSLADVIRERKSEYDNETLRTVGDGKRVAKRYTAPAVAMSLDLDLLGFIVCPKHLTAPVALSRYRTQTLRLPIYADSSRTQDTPAVGVIGCFAEVI